ncbi:MAG: hypothetical protein JST92_04135 [Deltaproteobacteria bacterium]|nr:hypothetical protein [Deltaproteobacteria bacterium]
MRLGSCLDLLDPRNTELLRIAHEDLRQVFVDFVGTAMPRNANTHKFLDCAVFNWLYGNAKRSGRPIDSCRAAFVPLRASQGLPRLWKRSGVFEGAHIQLCVRDPKKIVAVWPMKRDGTFGKDQSEKS